MSQAAEWDFFLSYTQSDRAWAEWIAWELEENGHRVLVQAWDGVPGSNWPRNMQHGTVGARRTIAVLSADYLDSTCASAEWQAVWAADPDGQHRQLLPVRVADCKRPGLLAAVVSVDLFGLTEAQARAALLTMVAAGRAKPHTPPGFPGAQAERAAPDPAPFPGSAAEAAGKAGETRAARAARAQPPIRPRPVVRRAAIVAGTVAIALAVAAPLLPGSCRDRLRYEVREHANVLDEHGNLLVTAEVGELFVLMDQPVDISGRRYGAVAGKEQAPGYVLQRKLRPAGTVCV